MFRKSQIILQAFTILLLGGCSMFDRHTSESVLALAEQSNYDQAIIIYHDLSPDEKTKVDLQRLEAARINYEKTVLKNILALAKNNDFSLAQSRLKDAIKNIPSSEALQNASLDIESQIQVYLKRHMLAYDMARAAFLIEEMPLLESLLKAKADDSTFMENYSKHARERQNLGESLGLQGLEQLGQKDQILSIKLLNLAQALKPDDRWEKPLKQIEQKQQQAAISQKGKKLKEEQAQKENFDKLLSAAKSRFEAAMVSGDLKSAQTALAEVNKMEASVSPWQITARQRLENTIENTVKMALKEGQALYSSGEINKALKVWLTAQPFAPDNEVLNESIKRAEIFQKNLINLSTPENSPKAP